ncbi:MAG: 23S rRNA (uracil(1939)-C(5))-methyltransferase RlmD [Roseburia sp.]|nr:23S rRNA (uracil(1939)-C(5))-methyltransferase RlmD [Roseburia sp.]
MNVKDVIEVEIISNGMDGEGIARVDGKVLFVPYTLKGERVRVAVKQVKKSYAFATAVKVIAPSPHRTTPECPHFYKCGGCDMGHIDGEYRREILTDELKNNFKKIVGVDCAPTEFIAAPTGCGATRNKISMPFGTVGGNVVLGLYRHNTHTVEPVDCAMQAADAKKIARAVCDFANSKRLSVYDERSGDGLLRHLVLRSLGGRTSAVLVVNGTGKLDFEAELAARLPDTCDFFISENTRRNNVIMGDTVRLIKGNARISAEVSGVRVEVSPLSFFQVNDYMRDRLYAEAMSQAASDTLIDLYSGIGVTSNLAAKKCKSVVGVEIVPQAVADADRTARLNGNADRIRNICGDVAKAISELRAEGACNDADVLVDPPRKGCGAQVMRELAEVLPNRLIYISCNHATMCRDIRLFLDAAPDYNIATCKMFDMFPNTHHTEVLVCLERRRDK